MAEVITLEFLAGQPRRMLDEMASMRGDIRVLTAIVLRQKETLVRMLEQLTAMVAQNARTVDRLRAVDERASRLEEHNP